MASVSEMSIGFKRIKCEYSIAVNTPVCYICGIYYINKGFRYNMLGLPRKAYTHLGTRKTNSPKSQVPCFDAQNCATCCKATSMSTILDAPWQALGEQSMLDMDVLRRESALQPWLRMQAPALHVPAAVCCTSHRTQTMGVLKKHSVLVLFATCHSRKWGISRQLQCVPHVVWLIYHGRRSSTQHRLSLTI